MLIPLTTDRPQRHSPLATWGIILLNILLFLAMAGMETTNKEGFRRLNNDLALDPVAVGLHAAPTGLYIPSGMDPEMVDAYRLPRNSGGWWTFLSYQFVHGGFMHLLGNMLVLWVFGPSVEDRFGKMGFAVFYLLGGVLAGVMHGTFQASPVIGASGSIAAVTGAFLVLFPRTHIKLLMFFVYVGVFELPAWVFIVFAMVKDIWGLGTHGDEVAFLAHIGGYLMGFSVAMLLLLTKMLPDEDWSLLAVFRQSKRRAEFKRLAFEADRDLKAKMLKGPEETNPARAKPLKRGVEERVLWQRVEADEAKATTEQENIRFAALRTDLAEKVAKGDADGAAASFRAMVKEGRATSGNRRVLVEAGNLFTAAGKHATAAEAYETFLQSLKGLNDPEEGRVRLMLALVAHRYLKDPKRAAAALAGIKTPFRDPELHALAEVLRQELKVGKGA